MLGGAKYQGEALKYLSDINLRSGYNPRLPKIPEKAVL